MWKNPNDEYVLVWIRDKNDAKKEAERRGIPGYKKDFEVDFLLKLLEEAIERADKAEDVIYGIEESHNG